MLLGLLLVLLGLLLVRLGLLLVRVGLLLVRVGLLLVLLGLLLVLLGLLLILLGLLLVLLGLLLILLGLLLVLLGLLLILLGLLPLLGLWGVALRLAVECSRWGLAVRHGCARKGCISRPWGEHVGWARRGGAGRPHKSGGRRHGGGGRHCWRTRRGGRCCPGISVIIIVLRRRAPGCGTCMGRACAPAWAGGAHAVGCCCMGAMQAGVPARAASLPCWPLPLMQRPPRTARTMATSVLRTSRSPGRLLSGRSIWQTLHLAYAYRRTAQCRAELIK